MFRGREDIVAEIKDYLTRPCIDSDFREPLVLYGVSGSGKTSILAKAASMVSEWMTTPASKPVLVLRFLGECTGLEIGRDILCNFVFLSVFLVFFGFFIAYWYCAGLLINRSSD